MEQNCVWFFSYINFERDYDVLKSKSSCILLNKNFNFNKNETESKMENPTQRFKREEACTSAHTRIQNLKKLWWAEARRRKKRASFEPFILLEGHFFYICVLYQCIVYWIHFQNIHTFTHQKTSLQTFFSCF